MFQIVCDQDIYVDMNLKKHIRNLENYILYVVWVYLGTFYELYRCYSIPVLFRVIEENHKKASLKRLISGLIYTDSRTT
jgi:hypothetical protein